MHDQATWKTAPPLWRDALAGTIELDRPALLRFDSDDFIERLQSSLSDPGTRNVGALVLRDETWKAPRAGLTEPAGSALPKLYQPIHGRHYLVAGGLVCERYGLPDKVVRPNCDESVFFVLRRLQPVNGAAVDPTDRSTFHEFGWAPSGSAGSWVALTNGVIDGEEHLPLFPMTYLDGHRRRVLAGTIPVAAREKYEGALPPRPMPGTVNSADSILAGLALPGRDRLYAVSLAYESLVNMHAHRPSVTAERATFDRLFLEAWFFALVDLAEFLNAELPGVLGTNRSPREQALANQLELAAFRADGNPGSWLAALRTALANRTATDAPPPPVNGMNGGAATSPNSVLAAIVGLGLSTSDPVAARLALFGKLNAALPTPGASGGPSGGGPATQAPLPSRDAQAVYITRLVYERPRCGESHRVIVDAPSEPFQLAHFYDPDAPFRQHKIVLPVDPSLAELRKFPKAVRIELSNQLRKQVERIQAIKLSDLEDGTIPPEGSGSLGMICSLSIPIITICALILLMIIVSLLNIIFFWVPLFKICLPKVDD